MFVQAFNTVWNACMEVWALFNRLLGSFGFAGVLLTLFGFSVVIRFLLKPLFGYAASDTALDAREVGKNVSSTVRSLSSARRSAKANSRSSSK